jgi:hypothetical protein
MEYPSASSSRGKSPGAEMKSAIFESGSFIQSSLLAAV